MIYPLNWGALRNYILYGIPYSPFRGILISSPNSGNPQEFHGTTAGDYVYAIDGALFGSLEKEWREDIVYAHKNGGVGVGHGL